MNMIAHFLFPFVLGFVFCGGPPFHNPLVSPPPRTGGVIENGPGKPICTYCQAIAGGVGAVLMMLLAGAQYEMSGFWGTVALSIAGGLFLGNISNSIMRAVAKP